VISSITYAYIFGVVMAAVNMLGSAAAFCLHTRRLVAAVNLVASLLGMLALLGGSLVTMLISHGGGALVNLAGKPVGISATPGYTFVTISWMSVLFMAVGWVYWIVELTVARFKARVARIRARVVAELAAEGRLRDPEEMEMLRRQESGEYVPNGGEDEQQRGDDWSSEDGTEGGDGGDYDENGYPRDEKAMIQQQQLDYINANGGGAEDGYDEENGGYYHNGQHGGGEYDEDGYPQQSAPPPGYDDGGFAGGAAKPKKKKKKATKMVQ
jgi:hypothetical protein